MEMLPDNCNYTDIPRGRTASGICFAYLRKQPVHSSRKLFALLALSGYLCVRRREPQRRCLL
jgi:hypothetical protein